MLIIDFGSVSNFPNNQKVNLLYCLCSMKLFLVKGMEEKWKGLESQQVHAIAFPGSALVSKVHNLE